MTNGFVKCFACAADRYQNQLKQIRSPGGIIYMLCSDCHDDLMGLIADKGVMGEVYRKEMSIGERKRMHRERGRKYARNDFEMGVWA